MSTDGRQSSDAVYEQVREAILDGELAPGTVMSQVALADDLGISRTPLREALRMLQSEGLIDAEPNRRVRVAPLSPADLEDLCVIRVTLESEALRLSIPRMTPEDLAGLEGYMAEMSHYASAEDYRRWVVPHRAFHRALTAAAGDRLNTLLGQLFDYAERYRRLHIGHGPSAWATAGHRDILDACKRGDKELGARLLASHLARTAFEVSELLDPSYDPVKLKEALEHAGAELPKRVDSPKAAKAAKPAKKSRASSSKK
jgi:GntR family transcriptional regulator, rspAB operon transcriptional repressor